MRDQADKLRQAINNLKLNQPVSQPSEKEMPIERQCKVITVTSGKGGVGKSNISANLALYLSQMGYRVVILDADFGLSNIDVLFGTTPRHTLLDVISNNKNIFDILSDGPLNVKFISGGSGVEEMAQLRKPELDIVIEKTASLDKIADIIIVDTGAGISENVISFVLAADEVILVTTPEPTSIMDAYALVKTVSQRDQNKMIQLLVNRAENEKEAISVINKLCFATGKFLNVKLRELGFIFYDTNVAKAVKQQEPFIMSYPKSMVSKQLSQIAKKLVVEEPSNQQQKPSGIRGFFSKLARLNTN